MIIALMLVAAPLSAIDAERAVAADAQKAGQWTAFRKYAAPEAVMFVPQPANAQAWLKGRKDPPFSVYWWPGRSYVSCDGNLAVNTGPWVREFGKSVGYFTTVWQRQPNGAWKWTYDAGDALKFARDEGGDIKPVIADCKVRPQSPPAVKSMARGARSATGGSRDGTVRFAWQVAPDGAREFRAWLWDGKTMQPVIEDKVEAPPK